LLLTALQLRLELLLSRLGILLGLLLRLALLLRRECRLARAPARLTGRLLIQSLVLQSPELFLLRLAIGLLLRHGLLLTAVVLLLLLLLRLLLAPQLLALLLLALLPLLHLVLYEQLQRGTNIVSTQTYAKERSVRLEARALQRSARRSELRADSSLSLKASDAEAAHLLLIRRHTSLLAISTAIACSNSQALSAEVGCKSGLQQPGRSRLRAAGNLADARTLLCRSRRQRQSD
jgi:hypothetical protein